MEGKDYEHGIITDSMGDLPAGTALMIDSPETVANALASLRGKAVGSLLKEDRAWLGRMGAKAFRADSKAFQILLTDFTS